MARGDDLQPGTRGLRVTADPYPDARPPEGSRFSLLRWLAGADPQEAPTSTRLPEAGEKPVRGREGVCFSGGGVRSASFNLGVLQALQEAGRLEKADYLSAVSGGCYIASSYVMVRNQSSWTAMAGGQPPYARQSPEEQYLRNRTTYLAPDLRGKLNLAARVLAGAAINLGLVWLVFRFLARPLGWAYVRTLFPCMGDGYALPCREAFYGSAVLWTVAVPALVGVGLGILVLLTRPAGWAAQAMGAWSRRLLLLAAVAFGVLVALPALVDGLRWLSVSFDALLDKLADVLTPKKDSAPDADTGGSAIVRILLAPATLAILGAGLRAIWAKGRTPLVNAVAWVVAPLALLTTFVVLVAGGAAAGYGSGELRWWLGGLALLAAVYAVADLTNWSIHPFYKWRLGTAFAIYRTAPDTADAIPPDRVPLLSLCQPGPGEQKPQLVVSAAVNLSDYGLTAPGAGVASFTFTRDKIGSPLVGYADTRAFEEALGGPPSAPNAASEIGLDVRSVPRRRDRRRDVSLLAATAVTGAAISPSMGKMTRAPLRLLMALLNVRLGVWLPNPKYRDRWKDAGLWYRFTSRPRPHYLLREMLGRNHVDAKFLYVTDGGHYENLGLVELLRRGCTRVLCFDAAGDQEDTFNTIGEAIAIARAELGVEIELYPETMAPCRDGGRPHTDHVVGTLRWPGADGPRGFIVFAKAAVPKEAPWDVEAYRRRFPAFPCDTTLDQFFDAEQFEAYRALGHFTGARTAAAFARTLAWAEADNPVAATRPGCAKCEAQPAAAVAAGNGRRRLTVGRLRG